MDMNHKINIVVLHVRNYTSTVYMISITLNPSGHGNIGVGKYAGKAA